MSPMLNPHTNQPDPQKVGAERWGFLISQSNEFPEAVLHLAESSSSSSKQQINTNNSNNINILLLVISTFNLSSHLYNHISLFCHSSGGSTLLTKSLQSVILEVLYWNKASVCSDPGRRSAQSFQLQLEWLYMTIDTYHLYIYIYKTRIGWYAPAPAESSKSLSVLSPLNTSRRNCPSDSCWYAKPSYGSQVTKYSSCLQRNRSEDPVI